MTVIETTITSEGVSLPIQIAIDEHNAALFVLDGEGGVNLDLYVEPLKDEEGAGFYTHLSTDPAKDPEFSTFELLD